MFCTGTKALTGLFCHGTGKWTNGLITVFTGIVCFLLVCHLLVNDTQVTCLVQFSRRTCGAERAKKNRYTGWRPNLSLSSLQPPEIEV